MGEQPLPPYGACLLGSFNLVKYIRPDTFTLGAWEFEHDKLAIDIYDVVRAMDNVIDQAIYPLPEQEREAKIKRRMGLGVTGLANVLDICGISYGTAAAVAVTDKILNHLTKHAYAASTDLAREKGAFPLFNPDKYMLGKFVRELPEDVKEDIVLYGIRNSHLTSIAPTGTISLTADNVSSGIEPVYSYSQRRTVITDNGPKEFDIQDYAYQNFGVEGKTTDTVTVDEHLNMLLAAQKNVDSAVSKTCNVGDDVSWSEFKDLYMKAWLGGAKGVTTFRAAGKRMGIIKKIGEQDEPNSACYIDENGKRECGD